MVHPGSVQILDLVILRPDLYLATLHLPSPWLLKCLFLRATAPGHALFFAVTFILVRVRDAGYPSSSTSLCILKLSWASSIHLYICRYEVFLSVKI